MYEALSRSRARLIAITEAENRSFGVFVYITRYYLDLRRVLTASHISRIRFAAPIYPGILDCY